MGCFYFAYGSNMNPARVAARGLRVAGVRAAWVDGLRLVFDKGARDHPGIGHANVDWQCGARVEGVLYALTGEAELAKLDAFERTPINYSRDRLWVETRDGRCAAWTYYANPGVRRPGLKPDRAYLAHLLAGRPYLSERYFRRLERQPCIDAD
jgi:gamma-glutamylcyclotransferase (GGCT)/AIG2-like uncharacterized protein YtfP